MSSNQTAHRNQSLIPSDETKHRGANRSTKVAGKLKVLPEQPEPEPVSVKREMLVPPRIKKDREDGSASTAESDDDEGDDEEETEDVEVCRDFVFCIFVRI